MWSRGSFSVSQVFPRNSPTGKRNVWSAPHFDRVAVFKNGYGMVSASVELPTNKGSVETFAPLQAIHGTLWVTAPKQIQLEMVKTMRAHREVEEFCTNFPQLLEANLNQIAEIQVDGKEWITGRIESVQMDLGGAPKRLPGADGGGLNDEQVVNALAEAIANRVRASSGSGLLILHSERGDTVIPVAKVTMVRLPIHCPPEFRSLDEDKDQQLVTRHVRKVPTTHLLIDYVHVGENKEEKAVAQVSCVTRGLSWSPTYKLELSGVLKTAKMSMNCLLLNDTEDLRTDELVCVAGVPAMKYSDMVDPLLNKQEIPSVLRAITNPKYTYFIPAGMTGIDRTLQNHIAKEEQKEPSAHVDDLHFYKFNQVNLKKNDPIVLPVFENQVPFTDVYHCEVDFGGKIGVDEMQAVWHAIKIQNTTGVPWTTGPIMVTRDGVFTAHDSIPFVPPNGSTLISLARAMDVQVGFSETTKRADQSVEVLKHTYQAFDVVGHGVIKNLRKEPVTVLLSRNFNGQGKEADNTGKLSTNYTHDAVNPSNTIQWEVTLAPGETKELSHKYLVLRK